MVSIKKAPISIYVSLLTCSVMVGMDRTTIAHIPSTFPALPGSVIAYLEQLPHIKKNIASTLIDKAKTIASFLCEFANTRGGSVRLTDIDTLENKILKQIENNAPVECILVGFPAKSCNDETKVLQSKTIDMAECAGLLTLYHMCKEVDSVYQPGMTVGLWSREAHIYSLNKIAEQYLSIPLFDENNIEQYQKDLGTLVKDFHPTLKTINIENTRTIFDAQYAQLDVEPAYNIKDYAAFMKEELNQEHIWNAIRSKVYIKDHERLSKLPRLSFIKDYSSWYAIQDAVVAGKISTKQLSYLMGQLPVKDTMSQLAYELADAVSRGSSRNRALLHDSIPNYASHIRLSVSPSEDGSVASKLGISLVYGSTGTTWHNILALTRGGIELMHRKRFVDHDGEFHSKGRCKEYSLANLKLLYMDLESPQDA